MSFIFKDYKGREINTWSYSAGTTFDFCQKKFELSRILGWRSKDTLAASKFGVAIEEAIQFFHQNGNKPESGIDEFKRVWLKFQKMELVYKAKEGTWEDLYKAGSELMHLYEVMVPSLPIVRPEFQLNYKKEVFPGTALSGIEDQGFVDMLSRAPWNHRLLPTVKAPADSAYRPLIIDIKSSGKGLDATPDLIQLDPQLRRYAWQSGIRDVGFLWFHRMKPGLEKGTGVTILESFENWKPLDKAEVVQIQETKVLIATAENAEAFSKAISEIKGKGSTEKKEQLLEEWKTEGKISTVDSSILTKQRIRFVAVRIPEEDVIEEGKIVGRQIVEAKAAADRSFFPKTGAGVRFPKQNCVWCEQRGNCLQNSEIRDKLLIQIKPAETVDDDWLGDLGDE
jgi:hypothetical protein